MSMLLPTEYRARSVVFVLALVIIELSKSEEILYWLLKRVSESGKPLEIPLLYYYR